MGNSHRPPPSPRGRHRRRRHRGFFSAAALVLHLVITLSHAHTVSAQATDPLAGVLGNSPVLVREPDDGSIALDALSLATSMAPDGGDVAAVSSASADRVCDYDGGILTLSHPHDLGPADRHFGICNLFLRAYVMAVDRINAHPRCGVAANGKRYGLRLRSYGIESNQYKSLAASRRMEPTTDFFLGPYTSGLTDKVSEVADGANKVMIAPGSYFLFVYEDRPASFGVLPLPGNYLKQVIPMLSKLTNARTVQAVYEGGPGAQCLALPELARANGLEVQAMNEVPRGPALEALVPIARNMSRPEEDPDVVVTCTYEAGCAKWMAAMRAVRWSPRAQVFSICVGLDTFESAVGTDAEFVLGMSPWDRSVDVVDGAANWTSAEFAPLFEAYSGRGIAYHAALGVATVSSLVQAIERADSLETDLVAAELRNGVFPTLFGNVEFDANGQNDMNLLALQYDAAGKVGVVYPPESRTAEFVYPMPTFDERDCVHLSPCGARDRMDRAAAAESNDSANARDMHSNYAGICMPDGTCQCDEDTSSAGVGATAACYEIVEEDMNYINSGLKAAGYACVAIQLFVSLALTAWTFHFRMRGAVTAAQPIFLTLILAGSAILSLSIVPMGVETGYRYRVNPITGDMTDIPNPDIGGVDAACMAVPWLIVIGFIISYSALFAKTWRIKKIFEKAAAMRRVVIQPKDVAFIMAILLTIAIVILLTWQFVAPLKWEREVLATNDRGYPMESIGKCTSDGALPFLVILAIFIFGCLLFALYLSYVTRKMPCKYNEGKWVTASILSIFQILLLAVPVLVIVVNVTSDAYYFVRVGIVFLISAAITAFVFGPKIYAIHVVVKQDETTGAKSRGYNFTRKTIHGRGSGMSNISDKSGVSSVEDAMTSVVSQRVQGSSYSNSQDRRVSFDDEHDVNGYHAQNGLKKGDRILHEQQWHGSEECKEEIKGSDEENPHERNAEEKDDGILPSAERRNVHCNYGAQVQQQISAKAPPDEGANMMLEVTTEVEGDEGQSDATPKNELEAWEVTIPEPQPAPPPTPVPESEHQPDPTPEQPNLEASRVTVNSEPQPTPEPQFQPKPRPQPQPETASVIEPQSNPPTSPSVESKPNPAAKSNPPPAESNLPPPSAKSNPLPPPPAKSYEENQKEHGEWSEKSEGEIKSPCAENQKTKKDDGILNEQQWHGDEECKEEIKRPDEEN